MFNKVHVGDCRSIMAGLPEGSVDLVVTSPPYWALRNYGIPPTIWGGDPGCVHEWVEVKDAAEGYTSKTRWQHSKNGRGEEAVIRRDSPEFWGTNIREYSWCEKCGAWMGTLGLEPHPQLYVDHMVEVCRGVRRVLKPTGSLWLNLGDSYHSGGRPGKTSGRGNNKRSDNRVVNPDNTPNRLLENDGKWLQPKQLLGIPWRVAAALQDDGWVLRNCIVWHKPNSMPSSVKDRLKNSYEFVFFFVKQRRYYFDLDAVRVPHKGKPSGNKERKPSYQPNDKSHVGRSIPWTLPELTKHDQAVGRVGNFSYSDPLHVKAYSPDGKNPGDVWSIPTHPFTGAHFAVFPEALVEPIIKAACPKWVCNKCGKPRERLINSKSVATRPAKKTKYGETEEDPCGSVARERRVSISTTIGWSDCGCGADWVNGVVLDPFAGSGTTLRVARRLGRSWVGIEINPEYAEMCMARVKADDYAKTPNDVMSLIHFNGGKTE